MYTNPIIWSFINCLKKSKQDETFFYEQLVLLVEEVHRKNEEIHS